jgi:hypothetical protein
MIRPARYFNSFTPTCWRRIDVNVVFALEFGLPAPVIDGERLKRYVFFKLRTELPVGPFCILYVHTTVQSDDNNPGMSILRTIYEELPPEYKERLQVFYFLHPGLRSRLAIATLGRLFLSGGLVLFLSLQALHFTFVEEALDFFLERH